MLDINDELTVPPPISYLKLGGGGNEIESANSDK